MAERVHPDREDRHLAPPTAPPLHSSIEMPPASEQSIRREQEQGLLKQSNGSTNTTNPPQQKDFVHRVPAPLPPNHPAVRYERRKRRRRSPCCCCLISFCSTIAAIIVILAIAVGVFYLVVRPKIPDYSVDNAQVSQFAVVPAGNLSSPSLSLDANVTVTVRAENPNSKIGIYYDQVDVTLFYQEVQIGSGSIPAFYQGHKNTSILDLDMVGQSIELNSQLASSLNSTLSTNSSSLPLEPHVEAKIRIKIGAWKSKQSTVAVTCNIEISNPAQGNVKLLSKECSFKLKKLNLFW